MIAGANSGIGYTIAEELATADEDFNIIFSGRDLSKVESALSELKKQAHSTKSFTALQLDVTDQDSIDQAASTVHDRFGRLDILINNAGIAPEGPNLAEMFHTTFETNVFGPVLVSAAFRPLLLASKSPWSIYVGSETGSLSYITDPKSHLHVTTAGSVAYRASKSALNMIAMHEQLEVKDTKLKVRIICPGFVVSNLRGPSEEARQGGGRAGDPTMSARLVLSVLRGEREADAKRLIQTDGYHPW